jgi:hypothetical protein
LLTKYASFSRSLPSWLYKILAQNWIDYEFPRHLFIETTANCNLSCEFCPRENRKEDMDFSLFTSIIDEAKHYGPRSFSLHLFGEPLLYPRILDAIRYIKQANRRNTVLLTTNGTLLNKFSRELSELHVDKIIWSWRKNNFDDFTLSLLKRIGLIRFLIEETPEGEIEKWEGFQKEVKHLHNYGGYIDTAKWGLDEKSGADRYPCYHLWLAPAIRWNGEITICCNDPKGVESSGVYSSSYNIHDYWSSDRLRSIRDSHMRREYNGVCKGCTSWQAYPSIF